MTKRFEKKKVKPRFILVRSAGQGRQCSNYAGPLQLPYSSDVSDQRSGKASPFNMTKVPVLANDRVHFADSFPFLLTSIDSLNALRAAMDVQNYPMTAFRPNIVVDTGGKAFEEEKWGAFRFSSSGIMFRQLKLCPRCTVRSLRSRRARVLSYLYYSLTISTYSLTESTYLRSNNTRTHSYTRYRLAILLQENFFSRKTNFLS